MISVVGILIENQNALRHNRLIHANSTNIINNNLKVSNFSYKSHKRLYDYKTTFDILETVDIEITDNALCINLSDYLIACPDDKKSLKLLIR